MKNIIINLVKIILSLTTIPLWFVKFFHGVGHLPSKDTGEIVEVHFYHSMYENMISLGLSFLFYISIIVVVGSVVFSVLNIKSTDKKINKISNIIFVVTIVLFLLCLVVASTVARGY